jgi:2-polyprenyl-3-methyl-5-hydroxy-6-metoxy-1,4-benzoquinol methylase
MSRRVPLGASEGKVMNQFEVGAEKYWNERYQKEGPIWGDSPSRVVWIAIQLFGVEGASQILIPGCGYGRLSSLFSMSGFAVTGVDISATAVEMAKKSDERGVYYRSSALNMDFDGISYDAVFAFNLLHLMLESDRKALIKECSRKVKSGALMFFTVFSEKEEDFGKGAQVEENTFESRPGRPAHYFSEADLAAHFRDYEVVEMGLFEESEDHGGKPHTHQLRYICVKA